MITKRTELWRCARRVHEKEDGDDSAEEEENYGKFGGHNRETLK